MQFLETGLSREAARSTELQWIKHYARCGHIENIVGTSVAPPRTATSLRLSADEKKAFERTREVAGLSLNAWMLTSLRRAAQDELAAFGELPAFFKPPTKKRRI